MCGRCVCEGLVSAGLGTGKYSETENFLESLVLSLPGRKLGAGQRRREAAPLEPCAPGVKELRGGRGAGWQGGGVRGDARGNVVQPRPQRPAVAPGGRDPHVFWGRDGTDSGSGCAYLEVRSPVGHAAHDDVCRGHGPGGREAEAHVAGCAHLEAEGEPAVPRAPAQPVLALRVQEGAVREGPARVPRRRAGEQRPQHEQRPAAHPLRLLPAGTWAPAD